MARLIPAAERITRARKLIQQARALPPPADSTVLDLTYLSQVKNLLQQARDLVKFIPYTPSASDDQKREVADIFNEADQTEKELFRRKKSPSEE